MKKIIQLILFLVLIIISIAFYRTYFVTEEKLKVSKILEENSEDKSQLQNKNNLVKKLKYEVKFDENKQYIINAELSEITYENNVEVVKMNKVTAIFIDQTEIPLKIVADEAVYNNFNYNTNFSKNVKITYLDHSIISDKLDINFDKNIISIYENVGYEGLQGTIKADNIKINLITKKIEIYMDNKKNKVEVETK